MICLIRAEADDLGDLKALRLEEAALPDLVTLGKRLRRYTELLEGGRFVSGWLPTIVCATNRLPASLPPVQRPASAAIRLTQPGATPPLPGGGPKPHPIRKSGTRAGGS